MNDCQQQLMNKWNIRNLDPPPVTTYKVSTAIDTTGLRESFEAAADFFGNQIHLESDAALLSRTIYRMKSKFRSDKGFKFMQKLNKTLRKYSEVNILSVVNNFVELLPKITRPGDYLPTSNMLDYVIIRLQGLTAILCYIVETAKAAAYLMEERIVIGQFWKMAFFAYALISRIWFLCNEVINFCCQLYKKLLPMRNLLGRGTNSWVGKDYQFPPSLGTWLNIEQLKDDPSSKAHTATCMEEVQDDSDADSKKNTFCDLRVDSEGTENVPKVKIGGIPKQKSAFELLVEDEEMGEVINNDKHLPIKRIKKKKRKREDKLTKKENSDVSSLQLIENINSFKFLKLFLEKESILRKRDHTKCIYSRLDGLQWNMLQKKMKKLSKQATVNENREAVLLNKAINMLKSLL